MTIALWIVQILLALLFLTAGAQKLLQSKEQLEQGSFTAYAVDFSAWFLKALGFFEVLGAFGIILPVRIGILPWLTPISAAGLAVIMVGATWVRIRRGENQLAVGTVVFLLMILIVLYAWFAV